jgi:hypothetical protein
MKEGLLNLLSKKFILILLTFIALVVFISTSILPAVTGGWMLIALSFGYCLINLVQKQIESMPTTDILTALDKILNKLP